MTSNKLNRGLFRYLGLALVFVIAVSLGVCGLSLASAGGQSDNVARAEHTQAPDTTYLDINDISEWTYNETTFMTDTPDITYTYSPSTYTNYYLYLSGGYIGISGETLSDTEAKHSPGVVGGVTLTMYAYYRLPDALVTSGSTISYSANFSASVSSDNISNLSSSLTLCDGPEGGTNYASPHKVDTTYRYLRVYVTGNDDGLGLGEYIRVAGLHISISVTDTDDITVYKNQATTAPVTASWDGASSYTVGNSGTLPQLRDNFTTNNNIVGNIDGYDTAKGDSNAYNSEIGVSEIYLTSLRTDNIFTKSFSYLLYDHYTGLKVANLSGLDLLAQYTGETPAITDGSAYTYTRANTTMPSGLQSVTVQPFGYVNESTTTGRFRGLTVTAVYDGLESDGVSAIEYDSTLLTSYSNYLGHNGQSLVVNIGGLDYTAPYIADSIYYQTVYSTASDNSIWFDVPNIEYRILALDDARDKEGYRDIEYTYTLLYKAAFGDTYSAVEGYNNVVFTPNYNNKGADLSFSGLASGYYCYTLTATDALYRADSEMFASHKLDTLFSFVVDTGTNGFNWLKSVKADDVDYDGADWTNKVVTIAFNDIDSATIGSFTMEYWFKGTKTSLNKDTAALILGTENSYSFVIDNDSVTYADSESERWYCAEGFERTYYFKVTLESGKVFEFNQIVKFDNMADEVPYSSLLHNYTQTGPYADLLNLSVDVQYRVGDMFYDSYDKGSALTLMCKIGDGEAAPYTIVNSEISLDIFGGANVSAPTQKIITLWFVDEAGNMGNEIVYDDFYIDTATMYVDFTVNSVIRYYDNTFVTNPNLLSYSVYKNAALTDKLTVNDVVATFASVYADKNSGEQNVMVSNIALAAPEGSEYSALLSEYRVMGVNNDDTTTEIIGGETTIIGATHTIEKARIAVGWYKIGTVLHPYSGFIYQYTGSNVFSVSDMGLATTGTDTFVCLDTVSGNTWSDIKWAADLVLTGGASVSYDVMGNILTKNASVKSASLTGEDVSNYVITNENGSETNITVNLTLNPKEVTLTLSDALTKVYDGNTSISIGSSDYTLNGIADDDNIYLKPSELNASVLSSSAVGGDYTVLINTVLAGTGARNYILVDGEGNELTTATFDNVSVTPKSISVSFGTIKKQFDNKKSMTVDTAGSYINQYTLEGVLSADTVTLSGVITFPSENRGSYTDLPIACTLSGEDASNYQIVNGDGVVTDTLTIASASISAKSVTRIEILGIYAVDADGCYYFTDSAGNLYKEIVSGGAVTYNMYDTSGIETLNVSLAADANLLIVTQFISGGVLVINNQRINLKATPVYAFKYYDSSDTLIDVDVRPAANQAKVTPAVDFNMEAPTTITSEGFLATTSNFELTGAGTNGSVEFTPILFADVDFTDFVYWTDSGNVEHNAECTSDTVIVTYNTFAFYLKVVVDPENYTVYDLMDGGVTNAGQYNYRIRVVRNADDSEIIVQKTIIIEKASIALDLSDATTVKYGQTLDGTIAGLAESTDNAYSALDIDINNSVTYEYSDLRSFITTIPAPSRNGAGTYYMRAVYAGDANTEAVTSDIKTFKVTGVPFRANDIVYVYNADTIEGIAVSDVIDPDYASYANDFVVVYAVPSGNSEDGYDSNAKYTTAVPSELGKYIFMIVHKDRVSNGKLNNTNNLHLSGVATSSSDGNYKGSFTIGITSINSSAVDYTSNELAVLETTGGNVLPPIRVDLGTLYFYTIDLTGNIADMKNFNNGLYAAKEQLGQYYTVKKLYNTSLKIYDNESSTNKATSDYGTVKITMNASGVSGDKLFRYVINSDGTYDISEVEYTSNNDGTVSFTTDKLGYFMFAETFTPVLDGGNNNTMAIGIGVGGAAAAVVLAIGIGAVVSKKKRKLIK